MVASHLHSVQKMSNHLNNEGLKLGNEKTASSKTAQMGKGISRSSKSGQNFSLTLKNALMPCVDQAT